MRLALAQAQKNLGNTKENPSVGCVITNKNSLISAGCTSVNGRPHAEFNAANFSREKLNGANIYVTLEPCSHYGLTPPCTKIIINKKIKRVFYSIDDPDLRSKNKSKKLFNKKKIKVNKGVLSNQINSFYRSYLKSKKDFFPFVSCKIAISKDYYMVDKRKKWITNFFSRSRGHLIRSQHDCIITSSRTIISDNSKLTCRVNGLIKRGPARIVLDKDLKIPIKSNVLRDTNKFTTIIFYNKLNKKKNKYIKKK